MVVASMVEASDQHGRMGRCISGVIGEKFAAPSVGGANPEPTSGSGE